ncbi:helix-turn-helix domain-containing protein [Amycolatopsis samaneae]|uniref:Helix-turn-helix domain-containing protein n=1 Tax=Amycolatopsis samaneae TaxID=664691 RepID=A0ABW5GGF8_9PSEU
MPELVTQGSRRLGKQLRGLREASGLTTTDVADEIRQDKATVSRYERGEIKPKWPVLVMLLNLYRATEAQRQRAAELFEAMRNEPKPLRLPSSVPKAFRRLTNETRYAWRMRSISISLVPGLLQIDEYIAALAATLHDPASGGPRALGIRKARQQRLQPTDPKPLVFHAVLDESCLTRLVGGRDVMLKQLRHLLDVAEHWDNITIQVVPKETGDYGFGTGGLTIVDYDDDEPSWVYFEYPAGADLVENDEDVQRFANLFEYAARVPESPDERAVALSPDETITFIRRQIEVLEPA